jgi:hypothetical protein
LLPRPINPLGAEGGAVTQDEWVKKWRFHITGGFKCGYYAAEKMAPFALMQYQHELPKHVEDLLSKMWADAQPNVGKPPEGKKP